MLSFEQKKAVFHSYEDLVEKPISNQRVNYEYPKSQQRGKILATQLHPSGNGYVIGKYINPQAIIKNGYKLDSRGWINIKNFTESELHEIIQLTMNSMNPLNSPIRKKILITKKHKSQKIITRPISENLIHSCLYNWLGYGNLNAPIWFIEMEDDGPEIWENRTKTLEESLKLRSNFNLQMDFQFVLEELYEIPLESRRNSNIWMYMAAFLKEFSGEKATDQNIQQYLYHEKKLGKLDSSHFIGKFRPLPKKAIMSMEPYQAIWDSTKIYEEEIGSERISLIKENLINHPNVQLLITYESDITDKLLNCFTDHIKKISLWQLNNEKYVLYQIKLSKERNVLLLSSPFFSHEQISIKGIRDCVTRINRLKSWAL
ncbi:hypothetical protein R4Z10_12400 [Niallia sp. XMNu-256]|uniref:hypothetical protein n=1 Tax=Niallia sp. XMNu-256 TaxID=3082444 RepID=UPI0030D436E7